MTLTVTAYRAVRDCDGERLEEIAIPSDLAGVEVTRKTFYAGPGARRLGLVLLPQLATSNLWVWSDDLPALRAEVIALQDALTAEEEPYWRFRLNNILAAIDAASAHGADGVVAIE